MPTSFSRHLLLLSLLASLSLFASALHAEEQNSTAPLLTKECIAEPVFNGTACIYFNRFDAERENVVLVHGINGSALDWREQIAPLNEKYNLLLVDLPGFGDSSKAGADYSPDNYARFLHYVTQRYLDAPFYLVGHSLGGAITLLYSAYYPDDVKRLLVANVAGILHRISFTKFLTEEWGIRNFGSAIGHFFRGITGEWMNRIEGARPPQFDIELQPGTSYPPATIAAYSLIRTNFSPYIPLIKTPVMVLWQTEDKVVPLRTGQALAARLKYGYLELIPGEGHMPMLNNTQLFNQKMLAFFSIDEQQLQRTIRNYKEQPGKPKTAWVAECNNQRGMVFEGDFDKLELHQCSNVHIINSNVRELHVYESRFEMLNSHLGSAKIVGSEGMITASRFEAEIPLTLSRSRLDLAGVELHGSVSSIQITKPSELLFSISAVDSPVFKGPLFDLLQMGQDERL